MQKSSCVGRALSELPFTPCPFCGIARDRLLSESDLAAAVLDSYPLTEGHSLIVPRQHVASLFDLSESEQAAVWSLVAQVRELLMARFHPDGFNIGLNDGEAAGQTLMHCHIHVIPRRKGDVIDPRGGVRWIIPEKAAYWRKL